MECAGAGIDVTALMKPLLLKAVFSQEGEGGLNLDAFINVMIQEKMESALLQSIELPQEFADLQDVICLMLQMDKLKTLTAALKGEEVPAGAGLDKVIGLVVQLQMLKALEGAFGGGEGGTGGGTQ